ncbi:ribonuclease H [Senna tora]|uniref:Ribonuclease H n=1 Tax=Senna tora TaxID=362788 RepID=A0A834TR52_9FABA|nr:ribonuclease H [Senna tora]
MSEVIDRYGAWMSAQKPIRARRPRPNPTKQQHQDDKVQGSRFTILEESDHEEQDNGNINPINKENSESESKVWTKPRKNPIFEDHENKDKSLHRNLDMMVLGSPIKSDNKEAEVTEMQPDDGGGSVAMVISPIKNKEQNSKCSKDDRVESNQNQNRKDKPPDMGKKKPMYSKGKNAGKMRSKGSRREGAAGRNFALSLKEIKRIYKPDMRGGCSPDVNRCNNFKEWINRCNLIDLKPEGPFFTWEGPKRSNQEKLFKRLDRVLCTPEWSSLFSDASTKSLTKTHSDHHPTLLDTDKVEGNAQNRPFRFEICWMQHKEFTDFLSKEWDKDINHH